MRRAALGLAALAVIALTAALARGPSPDTARAASHREAPLISMDPAADISDFFLFRSYEPGKDDKVVMIMDVNPGSEPSSGPNYFNFDPSVRYSFSIDNDKDGLYDVRLDFDFRNEFRGVVAQLGLPLSYIALPPVTALDGPGSEGLGLRQKYRVTLTTRGAGAFRQRVVADGLIAVPSNVGPRTMPDYPALAQQGVHDIGGLRVFAGQRQDPFYIDLGGLFDTLNLRANPPLLGAADDANDSVNSFGVDMLAGFNVSTIAVEVPAAMLRATAAQPVIGAYASTSRPRLSVRGNPSAGQATGFTQVQRLANPLVNEVVIGTPDKDRWNAVDPSREGEFLDYYLRPRLATALEIVYGVDTSCSPFGSAACSDATRDDLVNVFLKYGADDQGYADLLRLNLDSPVTPLASQQRLTVLAGDNAGWPNGRRPRDDVTDVAIRAVGGTNYINGRAGDGVNVDDAPLTDSFPFLATPADGRDFMSGPVKTPHKTP